jgi:hypothetical protein
VHALLWCVAPDVPKVDPIVRFTISLVKLTIRSNYV